MASICNGTLSRGILCEVSHRATSSSWPDIEECESQPCSNGGTCDDHLASYTCGCSAGYMGNICEIGMVVSILLQIVLLVPIIHKSVVRL